MSHAVSAVEYTVYISSKAWQERRLRFIATTNGRCACGATDDLHVHHATYDNLGVEMDEDLRLVCQRCHSEIHAVHRRLGGSLQSVTDRVLRVIEASTQDQILEWAKNEARTAKQGKKLPWETPRHRRKAKQAT